MANAGSSMKCITQASNSLRTLALESCIECVMQCWPGFYRCLQCPPLEDLRTQLQLQELRLPCNCLMTHDLHTSKHCWMRPSLSVPAAALCILSPTCPHRQPDRTKRAFNLLGDDFCFKEVRRGLAQPAALVPGCLEGMAKWHMT